MLLTASIESILIENPPRKSGLSRLKVIQDLISPKRDHPVLANSDNRFTLIFKFGGCITAVAFPFNSLPYPKPESCF